MSQFDPFATDDSQNTGQDPLKNPLANSAGQGSGGAQDPATAGQSQTQSVDASSQPVAEASASQTHELHQAMAHEQNQVQQPQGQWSSQGDQGQGQAQSTQSAQGDQSQGDQGQATGDQTTQGSQHQGDDTSQAAAGQSAQGDQTQADDSAKTGQTFADFKKQEDQKKPFDPSTPVTGTLGMSEEDILAGDKNIFGRPIKHDDAKPKDAKGQFEAVLNATIPPHDLKLDEDLFKELLAGSISLLFEEKMEIITSIPQLKQEQIDQLMKILTDEKQKFTELADKHKKDMVEKEKQQMEQNIKQDQEFLQQEGSKKDDDMAAAEAMLGDL